MGTEIQKQEAAGLALQQKEHAQTLLATITTEATKDKFIRSLTIEKIVDNAQPISQMEKYVERREIKAVLHLHICSFVKSLNLKWTLSDEQVNPIVEDLLYKYPNESLEDFLLVFRKARMGEFKDENGNATIYRLDGAVIFGWMEQYLIQKYEVLERNLYREKDQIHNSFKKAEKDYLQLWRDSIEFLNEEDRKAGRKRIMPKTEMLRSNLNRLTEKEIKDEGQVKPKAIDYPFTPPELHQMAELKMQYGRECTDLYTGRLKPGMPSFEDWLKTK